MSKFYLSHILDNETDSQSAIINILRARGFFIELINGKYYLSDNATISDAQYLKKGVETYGLGKVIDKKDYAEKSRWNWLRNYRYGDYQYFSIKPGTIELIIDQYANIDSAIDFFHEGGQIGAEAACAPHCWAEFVREELGHKPSISYLESYVSFYVKAISACGVYTCYSCDGNHPRGGKIYVFSEYPSNILHECIWRYLVQPVFGNLPYIENGITFDDSTKEQVYRCVNEIAGFLYDNRKIIRDAKNLSVRGISRKYRKHHSETEIEEHFRSEFKKALTLRWPLLKGCNRRKDWNLNA